LPEPTATKRHPAEGQATTRPSQQPAASEGPADFPPPSPGADGIAARVRRECAAQDLPERVEDLVVLSRVVTLAFEGLTTPSRIP
jgi:hypothetical protein